ncbi:hypothetical protein [Pantoea stewartii]|uniref:hypothetical protein n=1 Tax=Pantoea stewartii TaxID=66269 RepID=UPI00197EB92E|nr:hypothetical protein [Pantoea stewartii]
MAKKIITMTEMAKRYGYTMNAVKSWRTAGLPYDERLRGIPEEEGTRWIVKNIIEVMRNTSVKEEMDLEKLREQKAKADIAQYTAQEKSQELISLNLVQQVLNQYCQKFKHTLRLVPAKYSVEILESAHDISSVKEKLREILDQSLIEIGDIMVTEQSDIEINDKPIDDTTHDETDDDETNSHDEIEL